MLLLIYSPTRFENLHWRVLTRIVNLSRDLVSHAFQTTKIIVFVASVRLYSPLCHFNLSSHFDCIDTCRRGRASVALLFKFHRFFPEKQRFPQSRIFFSGNILCLINLSRGINLVIVGIASVSLNLVTFDRVSYSFALTASAVGVAVGAGFAAGVGARGVKIKDSSRVPRSDFTLSLSRSLCRFSPSLSRVKGKRERDLLQVWLRLCFRYFAFFPHFFLFFQWFFSCLSLDM